MSNETGHVFVELPNEATGELGKAIAGYFKDVGIVLVTERLARAAFEVAYAIPAEGSVDGLRVDAPLAAALDELRKAAKEASERKPGERAAST